MDRAFSALHQHAVELPFDLHQRSLAAATDSAANRQETMMADRYGRDADRGGTDARSKAEAAFRKATTKPIEGPTPKATIPGAKELVSLRIDQDVLEHFQADGPGWQDRINAVLRTAAGL